MGRAIRDCDLCIVGAGYAALNGLNAAAKYMAKGQRVVVLDRRPTWGGQWVDQYDFVRLHQPYRMFTAGDQKWRLAGRDRSYLATRGEILDNLATVPRRSAGHLEVEPLFGHEYQSHRLRGGGLDIEARSLNGEPVRIRAKRLLKATGQDVEILQPLRVSSSRVRSVAVADPVLTTPEFTNSSAPVYVVGSGKTAMDCVRWLATLQRRKISVITGSGMWFFDRDRLFPSGPRRYSHGRLVTDVFLEIAEMFDGSNELEVMSRLAREKLALNVFGFGGNCRLGLLSTAERDDVLAHVDEAIRAHFVDVDGTRMVVRERGAERSFDIAEGSWVINCTSHIRELPHEPLLQDDGLVCAPQTALGFSGTSAYYVTHVWYRDELAALAPRAFRAPFEIEPKLRFLAQGGLTLIANVFLLTSKLPLSVVSRFQGDFGQWYPLYRRIPTTVRFLTRGKAVLEKAERLLDLRFSDPTTQKELAAAAVQPAA